MMSKASSSHTTIPSESENFNVFKLVRWPDIVDGMTDDVHHIGNVLDLMIQTLTDIEDVRDRDEAVLQGLWMAKGMVDRICEGHNGLLFHVDRERSGGKGAAS